MNAAGAETLTGPRRSRGCRRWGKGSHGRRRAAHRRLKDRRSPPPRPPRPRLGFAATGRPGRPFPGTATMPSLGTYATPILLLIGSNVFMTFAWYGHLTFKA